MANSNGTVNMNGQTIAVVHGSNVISLNDDEEDGEEEEEEEEVESTSDSDMVAELLLDLDVFVVVVSEEVALVPTSAAILLSLFVNF